MFRTASLILALGLFSACNTPSSMGGGSASAGGGASKASAAGLEEKEQGLAKLVRDLETAEIDLRLSTLKAEAEHQAAARKVAAAQRTEATAAAALGSYRELESVHESETVRIRLDRAKSRLTSAQEDLVGILDIYGDEQEARAKDAIIRRHREGVAFSEREVAQARAQARLVEEFKVPAKREALEWALAQAKSSTGVAQRAWELAELSGGLAVKRKENELKDMRTKIEKARRDIEKARSGERKDG
ncbi:MAG: hypothetical protein ACI8QC_003879 [Planctomycetota bacterium]|jgi:hypothetical protein